MHLSPVAVKVDPQCSAIGSKNMERRSFFKLSAAGAASVFLPAWGCSESHHGLAAPVLADASQGFQVFGELGGRALLDPLRNRVQLTDAGGFTRTLSAASGERDGFNYPIAAALDARGGVFVVDRGSSRVLYFDSRGELVFELGGHGTSGDALNYPSDAVVGADGTLYVSDALNQRVQVYRGGAATIAGGAASASFTHADWNLPRSLALDPQGRLLVLDAGLAEVFVLDTRGALVARYPLLSASGERLHMPRSLAVDSEGNAYVADYSRSSVLAIEASSGRYLSDLALGALGSGALAPLRVAMGPGASLYVATSPIEVV